MDIQFVKSSEIVAWEAGERADLVGMAKFALERQLYIEYLDSDTDEGSQLAQMVEVLQGHRHLLQSVRSEFYACEA